MIHISANAPVKRHVKISSYKSIIVKYRVLKETSCRCQRAREVTDNDVLCLTESQISNDIDLTDISEKLSTFKIYFNLCGVRHQNFVFCLG